MDRLAQLENRMSELEAQYQAFQSYDSIPYDMINAIKKSFPVFLFGTATLDFPNTTATNASTKTITVYGAKPNDIVVLGGNGGTADYGLIYVAEVTTQDTVTIRYQNLTGNPSNPPSSIFNVIVIQRP